MRLETAIGVIEMDAEPDLIGAAAKTVLQELQRLQAETESLWALAKLGRWCLDTGKSNDCIYVYGEENIIDKAEELKLLKVGGINDDVTITETPLAQLPEKRE